MHVVILNTVVPIERNYNLFWSWIYAALAAFYWIFNGFVRVFNLHNIIHSLNSFLMLENCTDQLPPTLRSFTVSNIIINSDLLDRSRIAQHNSVFLCLLSCSTYYAILSSFPWLTAPEVFNIYNSALLSLLDRSRGVQHMQFVRLCFLDLHRSAKVMTLWLTRWWPDDLREDDLMTWWPPWGWPDKLMTSLWMTKWWPDDLLVDDQVMTKDDQWWPARLYQTPTFHP